MIKFVEKLIDKLDKPTYYISIIAFFALFIYYVIKLINHLLNLILC
jgi:hypothetical protein